MSYSRKSAVAVVCATLALSACGGQQQQDTEQPARQQASLTGWSTPTCSKVIGTNAITFTRDEGATLTPVSGQALSGVAYTFGLVTLDTPDTLLAAHAGKLLKSTNAGCNWSQVATVASGLTLTAAQGGRAYAWANNGSSLYRVDGASTVTALVSPVSNILGLGVDAANGLHLRVGSTEGQLYESFDGGASWTAVGVAASPGQSLGYTVVFDPANLDKVFYGQAHSGLVSTNGGASWTAMTGLSNTVANVFAVVVSPANSQVVWVQAMDLETTVRKLYRSTDGGFSFTPVVTESATVTMTNGMLVVAHPTNASVVYFEFGTHFQQYGTDIYKYDHATGLVTKTHNAHDDVSSIAFSPADPSVMYFGLTSTN